MTKVFRLGLKEFSLVMDPSTHPETVVAELATECPYACTHCFRFASPNLRFGVMRDEVFKKLLADASEAGVRRFVFTGWGEPTAHPRFVEYLRLAREGFEEVVLNTNGWRLRALASLIAGLPVDELVISIEKPRGAARLGGFGADLFTNLRRLKELKGPGDKPFVRAVFTATPLNYRDLPELVMIAKDLGINEIVVTHAIPHTRFRQTCLDGGCPGLEEVFEGAAKAAMDAGVAVKTPPLRPNSHRSCPYMEVLGTYVRYDGSVAPCMYYAWSWDTRILGIWRRIRAVTFGNIMEKPLIDIWRSPEYAAFRARAYIPLTPSCLDCELVQYCSFTHSNDSDCFGSSPTCAHCPYQHRLSYCPT